MTWNWEKRGWPEFSYDAKALEGLEQAFLKTSGVLEGTYRHLNKADKSELTVSLISEEAYQTSAIEGEILNRDSVQSSIRKELGLPATARKSSPAESGIAEMMVDVYRNWKNPLSDKTLFSWHAMLLKGRGDISDIGCYRTHADPMQVVSGGLANPRVHFVAPPSKSVSAEMRRFIKWFNGCVHENPLARAGLAHLYFVSIHPFEDGNGRIGRAISEVALAQGLGRPSLVALSATIERRRKEYYQALELNNKGLEATSWLAWFARTAVEAQERSISTIEFLMAKTRLYDRLTGKLNERQQKALARMFREGVDGFKGGLSAGNYMSITKAPPSTATRDLQDLIEKGALRRTGALRHTRYFLTLE
jgi:Fic family protein